MEGSDLHMEIEKLFGVDPIPVLRDRSGCERSVWAFGSSFCCQSFPTLHGTGILTYIGVVLAQTLQTGRLGPNQTIGIGEKVRTPPYEGPTPAYEDSGASGNIKTVITRTETNRSPMAGGDRLQSRRW